MVNNLDAIKVERKNEVKSSAYIQSWPQKKKSTIQFGIAPKKGWEAETNTYFEEKERRADVYIFCLVHVIDEEPIDPMKFEQWTFYVLETTVLNEELGDQKGLPLSALKKLNLKACRYDELKQAVEEIETKYCG